MGQTDRQTQGHKDTRTHIFLSPPVPLWGQNFFLHTYVGNVFHNFKPCKISTFSLREAGFAAFTHKGLRNAYYLTNNNNAQYCKADHIN